MSVDLGTSWVGLLASCTDIYFAGTGFRITELACFLLALVIAHAVHAFFRVRIADLRLFAATTYVIGTNTRVVIAGAAFSTMAYIEAFHTGGL